MTKSIEQLAKLAQNPFYKMSDEEVQLLEQVEQPEPILEPRASSVTIENKKKVSQTARANAVVKETGKLDKHPSDPVSE